MKDFSNYLNLSEKPFSCDFDGCSMKFTNENHLTVHKKRHDISLNIGLGPKGSTFSDQTPTPTQFIRNCEEVGLFQDLQNVNPFEETFKKAVEAIKTGQPIPLEKPMQSSQPDDTLHTPNIFPHITDVPNINRKDICVKSENIPPCEEVLLKQEIIESEEICKNNITEEPNFQGIVSNQEKSESAAPLESVRFPENKSLVENKVILNVPEGHFVQLITPDNPQSSCNMVVIKNAADSVFPLTIKEKLKKSLSEKKNESFQQKVPISKCPTKKSANLLSNKFSKFSRNAMKLISKLENSNAKGDITESVPKKQDKKSERAKSKESRSEYLARSRAASSRCREKKKMYVLYLEKVNNELSTAYENLQLINLSLQKQIRDLHEELLKHKNCSAADKNTETTLLSAVNFIRQESFSEPEDPSSQFQLPPQSDSGSLDQFPPISNPSFLLDLAENEETFYSFADPFTLDVAEVILDDDSQESEIPLNESHKHTDIIVRFNSVGNEFPANILPSDSHLCRYIESAEDNVKQIYSEHSYFLKKSMTGVDKGLVGGKGSHLSSDDCKKLDVLQMRLKKNGTFADIPSLDSKVLLEPRTPPPLILLKPFKKRSLQNKQTEKT